MPKAAKCSMCGSDSIIFLHYSSRHLCKGHFIRMFGKRFRSTVREFSMIRKGERVAIGLSGGKDSVVLMHCLHALSKDLPMELVAITIDEGISGYRAATLKIAKKEAKRLGIEHKVVHFKKETGKSLDSIIRIRDTGHTTQDTLPCSWCGVLRRGLLNRASHELGADKLAMWHNLDDMAQTVLMNVLRNEPERTARLLKPAFRHPAFIPRIRPLMRSPERENAIYAIAKGIEIDHRECPYANSAFRQLVRAQLNDMEERHPGTKFKVLGSFLRARFPVSGFPGRDARHETRDAPDTVHPTQGTQLCSSCGEPSGGKTCKFCELTARIK